MNHLRKPVVLHVLKSSIYSGAEHVVITIIKALQQEYEFIYVSADGAIRSRLEQEQIPMELLCEFNRKELRKVIRKYQPDIVHAHDFSASVLCAGISGDFRLISHLHYDPPWVKQWNLKTLAYWSCSLRIHQVITVSQAAFDTMIFSKRLKKKQVTLRNVTDGDRIRAMADLVPEKEESLASCDVIFVGRFVEQKNPQRFIELIGRLKEEKIPGIRVWMLGDGVLLKECKQLVDKLGLEKAIIFKEFQDNPYFYMKRAKVLCITSRWEGFGLTAAEESLLGGVVVSTRNSGCSEIFGKDAPELCSSDEEFIEKMGRLLTDRDFYEVWRERACQRAEMFEQGDAYMALLTNVYRKAMI